MSKHVCLVFTKLYYCSSVWSNTSQSNIAKLQAAQNFACRIVCGPQKYDHVTSLLRQLNWLPVKQHLYYRDSIMAFKCMNCLAPEYLSDQFTKRSSISTYKTRNSQLLNIPLFRTAAGQRTFYLTIRLFALNFYEVIVDEAAGRINYHLIEIESE